MKHFKSLPLAVVACAIMLTACGGKDNKITKALGGGGGNRNSSTYGDAGSSGSVEQIKSQFSCQRRSDVTFTTSSQGQAGGYSKTTIFGPFQKGVVGGIVNDVFVGVSTFKDLIIVGKVTNGSQVVGYNITLSLCVTQPLNGSHPATSLINEQRDLNNFSAPYGITIDSDTNCSVGNVDAAQQTSVISGPNQYISANGNVITSFSKHCN
jgi:hypothetical protein